MKIAVAHLKSVSPYSQSRNYDREIPKLTKEGPQDYEDRTWRNRTHAGEDGKLFIPPMAFKNCLSDAAKYLSIQIPGKGKTTYTKHFDAGIVVVEPMVLPITREKVIGEWFHVPSDGKRGGGRRVWRCFPVVHQWEGHQQFVVLDDTVTKDVFIDHLKQAGQFIGIGRFRPRNGGFYGRFDVLGVKWS
jgi:hypothetical protein